MTVDPTFASALKSASLSAIATGASSDAWGERGIVSAVVSPLSGREDAQVEAARQAGFLDGPRAIDEHVVPGRLRGIVATVQTIYADRLGYEAGADVFVLEADETAIDGATKLTVIKRLAA